MTPLVSILIPCYNAVPWLASTLDSALAQTHPHTEIILVDDGSTDDSLAVARRYESRGVRVVTQLNAGASATRNHALRLANGDFIQFLDADDLLAPDKIARQLALLSLRETGVLLSGAWGRFCDDPVRAEFRSEVLCANFTPTEFMITKFSAHAMIHPGAWLVPRALIDAAGPWDERLSLDDDGEYFTRVVLSARSVRYCPTARSYYRSGSVRSLSHSRSDRAWTSQFLSLDLSINHLLALTDSAQARQAAADALQRLILEAYPRVPFLRAQAHARVAELGGSALRYEAGPRFHWVARVLGWKTAKRLRDRFGRVT